MNVQRRWNDGGGYYCVPVPVVGGLRFANGKVGNHVVKYHMVETLVVVNG